MGSPDRMELEGSEFEETQEMEERASNNVLKMLTELAATPDKGGAGDHQDREYQAFLVDLAKKKNIIVCLPTGSGKTFIALLLAKHYLKTAIETNRKIVFLANTVPLVNQQAEYFRKHLDNQFLNEESRHVECLTGDRQVDYWEPKKWQVVLNKCNVLVMTTQIFVDALGHNYMKFKDVIFLILDECHHTDKDAPMNKVMEMYRDILVRNDLKLDLQELPRILGLTATIINGKGKKIEVTQEVRDAEARLCARAVTYYKYEEVLKYSTCAKVDYVLFSSEESKTWSQDLAKPLLNFLKLINGCNKELFTEKLPDIYHPSFKTSEQRFNSKESDLKVLKSLVKEVHEVFKDLGPYCAKIAAIHKRAYIQTKNIDDLENIYTRLMTKALDTALAMFICQLERLMGRYDEASQVQIFITDKVNKLTEILKKYETNTQKEDDQLSGLIFVQQRITAQALTWYLEDAARTPAYKFIKPGFVVGSATYGLDPVEARITANEQAAVIRKFRSRDYNILVATRVLEEGLDVPACNLVIRFDRVHTYPSYVQSMGRARNKNSKFYGFIDAAEEVAQKEQYSNFEKYNMQLSEYLKQNAIHADDEFEDDVRTTAVEKIIPNFEPNPGRSPRITALESISIAQRYCQTLPCDKLVTLSPISWWEKVESKGYRAYVQFPSNSVIREIVPGNVQDTKMLAKRSAFLEACILLYKKKVLDEQLFPLPRRLNPVFTACIEKVTVEKDSQGRKVGSNKRTQQYTKKTPDCFQFRKILPGCPHNVYEIHVEQLILTTDRIASSLYRFGERNYVYCIITNVNLSIIPQFILNVNPSIGNLVVTLKEIQLQDRPEGVKLSKKEINSLQNIQRYIFGDLLKMKCEIMKPTDDTSLLIAPLKRVVGPAQLHSIHWDLVTKLEKLSDSFFSIPSDESRKRFTFKAEEYEDAVVVPWYRGVERFFYSVVDVSKDETPSSPFQCNKSYSSYESYFVQKYLHTVKYISDPNQRLLKAKLISSNLNFFKTNISFKKSQEERKDQRDSVVELIPELTNIHPLPASLYIQSKLLPSIIQRIHRFLLAHEIQEFVAQETPWNGLDEVRKDYTEEWRNLIIKNDPTDTESSPAKKIKLSTEPVANENFNQATVQIRQPLGGLDIQLAELSLQEEPIEPKRTEPRESREPILDFIHPRNLSLTQVDRIKDRSKGLREVRVKKSSGIKIDETDTSFDWKHDKETAIKLIEFYDVDKFIKEKLDEQFTFTPEKQPSLYTLMQGITMEASLDSVTLERLETIGDSFLKYCVSRHIYSYFPDMDEGKMTQGRSELVSNKHIYVLGDGLKLGEYLAAGIFRPDCAWLPPSFCIPKLLSKIAAENDLNEDVYAGIKLTELEKLSPEEISEFIKDNKCKAPNLMPGNVGYTHARISDKSIADSVEALIGAYFISGGPGGALHFMEKLGFRGPTSDENGKCVKTPYGQWPSPRPKYNPGIDSVSNHHSLFSELEDLLCYTFKEKWLLVEAFSHPCYMKNRVTGCYQRLEFLGDAVLDFLITNHIYKQRVMNPGQLTDLRSALVNNVTFGSLSVRYGFQTYLLNTDRRLQDAIDVFVECQKAAGHEVTGHFKLLSDLDCHLVSDIDCPKVLGDIFESLAGAVFIDCGMSLDTVWKVFYRLMKYEIDLFSLNVPKSPVRELYESNPGRKIFRDVTDEAVKAGALRDPGLTYVSLTFPVKNLKEEPITVIGVGKSKQNAKLAAAKYANKLHKFQKAKN